MSFRMLSGVYTESKTFNINGLLDLDLRRNDTYRADQGLRNQSLVDFPGDADFA
jgi:hypothetical protein